MTWAVHTGASIQVGPGPADAAGVHPVACEALAPCAIPGTDGASEAPAARHAAGRSLVRARRAGRAGACAAVVREPSRAPAVGDRHAPLGRQRVGRAGAARHRPRCVLEGLLRTRQARCAARQIRVGSSGAREAVVCSKTRRAEV